jgi:hypothetical protein
MQMKTKVTEQGVIVPKKFLKGIKEVEIRKGASLPYVEVHMTNVEARDIKCVIAPAASGVIYGLGTHSYILGLEATLHLLSGAKRPNRASQSTRRARG